VENIPANLGGEIKNCYKMGIGRSTLDDKVRISRKHNQGKPMCTWVVGNLLELNPIFVVFVNGKLG
jgi:hypothetical protein